MIPILISLGCLVLAAVSGLLLLLAIEYAERASERPDQRALDAADRALEESRQRGELVSLARWRAERRR